MAHFVFAYGTLQFADVLQSVLGRVPHSTFAWLGGYRRSIFLDACYPGAVPDKAASIHGLRLGPLTQHELQALDSYEGERYERVACYVGGCVCWIYAVVPAQRGLLARHDWDGSLFNDAARRRLAALT